MSEVTLTIGGRHYTVSCADGEEAHVTRLGQVIDGKLAQLGSGLGPNESRNFLFASLLLADDLHEKVKEMEGLQQAEADARAELSAVSQKLPALENQQQEAQRLADELKASRDTLQASIDNANAEVERMRAEVEALKAQQAASGEELRTAIAERDRLQGEIDSRGGEQENLRVELDGARAKIGKLGEEISTLRQEKGELGDEIDALRAAKQRGDSELAEARTEASRMAGELAELRDAPPAEPEFLSLTADPELAPALERFAEMLESCAAKLEGKASAA